MFLRKQQNSFLIQSTRFNHTWSKFCFLICVFSNIDSTTKLLLVILELAHALDLFLLSLIIILETKIFLITYIKVKHQLLAK